MKDVFQTGLDPRYEVYRNDLKLDAETVAGVVATLENAIGTLKRRILGREFTTMAGISNALCRIGQLSELRDRVDGHGRDVHYLLWDNRESLRYVAGFLGDPVPLTDSKGQALHVGDTIAYRDERGVHECPVYLARDGTPALPQEWVDRMGAQLKTRIFPDRTFRCQLHTVTVHSCVEDYITQRDAAHVRRTMPPRAAGWER